MQNIQITQSKQKRSMQSLIQDSAIDNQQAVINFQILQLKKAYNETYKSFNTKIQNLQSEIAVYKQKCKKLQEANVNLAQKCYEQQKVKEQNNQMKIMCEKMKRKVLYIQGKYQKLVQNRALVQQGYQDQKRQQQNQFPLPKNIINEGSQISEKNRVDKNQVYKQISGLISEKVKAFTKQIRVYSMTKELQNKIEAFLEQLIYITPISKMGAIRIKQMEGKSSNKKQSKQQQHILLTDQKAWREITKRIDQGSNERSITPIKRQNLFNLQLSKKSALITKSPITGFKNDSFQKNKMNQYRPSPNKSKIFLNE